MKRKGAYRAEELRRHGGRLSEDRRTSRRGKRRWNMRALICRFEAGARNAWPDEAAMIRTGAEMEEEEGMNTLSSP